MMQTQMLGTVARSKRTCMYLGYTIVLTAYRSIIEYMKQRIEYLEAQSGPQDPPTNTLSPVRTPGNIASETSHQHADPTASEVGYLSLAAMSGPDRPDQGFCEKPSFAGFVGEITGMSDATLTGARRVRLSDFQSELVAICNREIDYFLNFYCDYIAELFFPCAARGRCKPALRAVLDTERDVQLRPELQPDLGDITFSCLAVAMGIIFSPHRDALDQQLQRIVAGASSLLPLLACEDSDELTVSCLTMSAIVSLYDSGGASTWFLLGQAMTKSISIGLHHQTITDSNKADERAHPWLFWVLYSLDRTLSMVMDRPFGLEDTDVSLNLPSTSSQPASTSADHSRNTFAWRVHLLWLISAWRRDPNLDIEVCRSSLSCWRETYEGLAATAEASAPDFRGLRGLLRKEESQLSCQALVQLLILSKGRSQYNSLDPDLQADLIAQVPEYLTRFKGGLDQKEVTLTYLDAYMVLGATTAYLYCLYWSSERDGTFFAQRRTNWLGVSGMKVVMTAIEVLQRVAQRFQATQGFQDLLWSFLSAVEDRDTGPSPAGHEKSDLLRDAYARCQVTIPGYISRLMDECLCVPATIT